LLFWELWCGGNGEREEEEDEVSGMEEETVHSSWLIRDLGSPTGPLDPCR
jgi:hypothetical protein